MKSFINDPDIKCLGCKVLFLEPGFRTWSVKLKNPKVTSRLRYADYGEDIWQTYKELPQKCVDQGCSGRCPAPRTKEDNVSSLKRGAMVRRREERVRELGSTSNASMETLLEKFKGQADKPPPLPPRRRPPMQLDNQATRNRSHTPSVSPSTTTSPSTPSTSQQLVCPPSPRPVRLTLKLKDPQQEDTAAVQSQPTDQSQSTPSNREVQAAINNLSKIYEDRRSKVAAQVYNRHENSIQDATSTMKQFRTLRYKDFEQRFPWAAHSSQKRTWAAKPGAMQGPRAGYHKFAGVVKPRQSYYGRRVPSSSTQQNRIEGQEGTQEAGEEEEPKGSKQPKVHLKVEAWQRDPDAH